MEEAAHEPAQRKRKESERPEHLQDLGQRQITTRDRAVVDLGRNRQQQRADQDKEGGALRSGQPPHDQKVERRDKRPRHQAADYPDVRHLSPLSSLSLRYTAGVEG